MRRFYDLRRNLIGTLTEVLTGGEKNHCPLTGKYAVHAIQGRERVPGRLLGIIASSSVLPALAATSEAYFGALSRIGEKAYHTMSSRSIGTSQQTHLARALFGSDSESTRSVSGKQVVSTQPSNLRKAQFRVMVRRGPIAPKS